MVTERPWSTLLEAKDEIKSHNLPHLKAAIIKTFILTMDQMTVCVKGVARSDKPIDNCHPNLQLSSVL